MGCNCKKQSVLKRAKRLLNGNTFEDTDVITQGQIESLYYERFKKWGTEEELINWLNQKL